MLAQMSNLLDRIFQPQQVESLDTAQLLITLLISSFCGLVIFAVYRYFNKGVVYSVHYNMLILMVCVVTSLIIITIGSNLVLSLGMVGSLSIVRFRAAVKDPLDVGFLFWGVAAGLTAGARLYLVAILGTAFIAILYITLAVVRIERRSFLLIVRYAPEGEGAVTVLMAPLKARIKNKTFTKDYCEVTAEIRVRRGDTSFMEPIRRTESVSGVTLVEYTGDYA
jgi:hypothetical protein